jgi:signal transduction histidine kinase
VVSETRQQDRLRRLVEAGIALSSELSLDSLLQKLIETAAALTGARYAALGVIAGSGKELERFVYTGIDEDTAQRIGHLPRGRGILGTLIHDARPLRLRELSDDPRSVGFPSNHPPMRGFLGVPVMLRGVAYGNLYLTEKDGGEEFTQEDQDLVQLLAAQAAVAIENARLYESATRWLRQLESLTEVGNALSGEIDLPRLLDLVTTRLHELLDARRVWIALPRPDGSLRVEASAGDDADDLVGLSLAADSKHARVFQRRRSERVDSVIEDPEVDQEFARRAGAASALFVPLVVRDRSIGVLTAINKRGFDPRFNDDDMRLAETFGQRVAVAVDLSQRASRDAMRRVVEAQESERRRLARELHDETGQALTSVLLRLKELEAATASDEAREAATGVRELVVATLQDVRRLAVELRPKALDDFGLLPALERLVQTFREDTGIKADLETLLGDERLPSALETTLYRIVQEALTNVVKHAQARRVSILLTRKDGHVSAVIEDDGRGFDPSQAGDGFGLEGMRERVGLVDGRLSIESSEGRGTTLVVEVPE